MPRRRDKGQGGITKRQDGRWQGTYQDAQDRKRYVYGPTKRNVQEQLAEAQSQLRQGISLEPGRETVGSFMARWLRDVKAHDTEARTSRFYTELPGATGLATHLCGLRCGDRDGRVDVAVRGAQVGAA